MSKFKNLQKKLDVAEATSWIDLPEISPGARLQLRPAGESNPPYYNAMLRRSGKRARQMVKTDTIDAEMLRLNREDDRELFPLHVVVGWEGIVDDKDTPVPFSREDCAELLQALPNWTFDKVRHHAATPERFLTESDPDAEELSGNSRSASSTS